MGKKPMAPMAVSERAKQFMPFKAVAGLDEALERKRIEMGVIEGEEKPGNSLKQDPDWD